MHQVYKSGIPQLQKSVMPRTVIEEKLRSMQRKLSEIAEIPKILSSTLETVSQTFEKFIPETNITDDIDLVNESDIQNLDEFNIKYHFQPINDDNNLSSEKESGTQDDLSNPDTEINDEDNNHNNNKKDIGDDDDEDEFFEADSLDGDFQKNFINRVDDSPESDYISEEDEQYCSPIEIVGKITATSILMTLNQNNMPKLTSEEEVAEDDDDDDEEEVEDQNNVQKLKIEDPVKKEKNEKINSLEKSWPWADRQKIIYKSSTCHLVPKLSIVETRIKQLGGTRTLPCYERNRKGLNKSE